MSGSMSTYLETALLNHVFGGPDYIPPTAIFAALSTTMPTPDGGFTEIPVSGGTGYFRQGVGFSAPAGSPPSMSNPNAVQWPTAQIDWGVVMAGGLFDSPTGGNFLGFAPLVSAVDGVTPATINILAGMIMRLPPAGLVVGFILPPPSPVPFTPPAAGMIGRLSMRPIVGQVIDGAGVPRRGVVMAPRPPP